MVVHVGTSGWSYDHWSGVLYESGLPTAKRLSAYVAEFDTVELNASFYRWPKDATFAQWRERLPEGFRMSVKAARGLTHARRLRSPEQWIDRIAGGLRAARGPWGGVAGAAASRTATRRCPNGLLPRSTAGRVDGSGRISPPVLGRPGGLRLAGTSRGVLCGDERGGVTVRAEGNRRPGLHPAARARPGHLYAGSYSSDDLCWWADRICEWDQKNLNVLAYFNNDGEGNAVSNARELRAILRHAGVCSAALYQ